MNWHDIVDKRNLDYIIGNPPFIGKKEQSTQQKKELSEVFKPNKVGNLDYVSGWYIKAARFIKHTSIQVSYVSTNSISQGEQVAVLWEPLLNEEIEINYAYSTFRWLTEMASSNIAQVHVVIISFAHADAHIKTKSKYIFRDNNSKVIVDNINQYLLDASNVLIKSRTVPICNVPRMHYGSMPIDDGNLILSVEEKEEIISENKRNINFIRQYVGGNELINNKKRYCLWLKDINPKEYRQSNLIMARILKNKNYRLSSSRKQTIEAANTPFLFGEIRQPTTSMLVIPKVSSERRKYIPISYVSPDIIVNGSALIVPDADLYMFGILMSNVHMAWMRIVTGRMKSDYQYSARIVYNNFPWPNSGEKAKEEIRETAQNID